MVQKLKYKIQHQSKSTHIISLPQWLSLSLKGWRKTSADGRTPWVAPSLWGRWRRWDDTAGTGGTGGTGGRHLLLHLSSLPSYCQFEGRILTETATRGCSQFRKVRSLSSPGWLQLQLSSVFAESPHNYYYGLRCPAGTELLLIAVILIIEREIFLIDRSMNSPAL